jgi:hypothetical protein
VETKGGFFYANLFYFISFVACSRVAVILSSSLHTLMLLAAAEEEVMNLFKVDFLFSTKHLSLKFYSKVERACFHAMPSIIERKTMNNNGGFQKISNKDTGAICLCGHCYGNPKTLAAAAALDIKFVCTNFCCK